MISKIRKSSALGTGNQRAAARMTLGFVAVVLCLLLLLTGASLGGTSAFFAQPSPSGSRSPSPGGSPSAPASKIVLLNPNVAYDPGADVREPAEAFDPRTPPPDIPKVSDKFDGVDTAYHLVAAVSSPPENAVVEAYFKNDLSGSVEITIGELSPVPGSPDTWELFWDIPESIDAYYGTITVRLYRPTPAGFEEVANHSQEVRLQHKQTGFINPPEGIIPEAETVDLTWPSQGGPLGFYRGAGGGAVWRTWVNGSASLPELGPDQSNPTRRESAGASRVAIFYSRTPPGSPPEFVHCGEANTSSGGPNGVRRFRITCALDGTHRPSQVTALAAVGLEDQSEGEQAAYSQEAADVHRVHPYLQRVEDMTLTLATNVTTDQPLRRHIVANSSCISYKVSVVDQFDRPVQGANVDVHARGPGDGVEFGTDNTTTNNSSSSGNVKPQKGHATESGRNCDTRTGLRGEMGDHNVPGADDIKHVESTNGTGVSAGGTAGAGEWVFHLNSANAGDTQLTAWVDDEPVPDDTAKRDADDDLLEPTEASDTNFIQWLPAAPAVSIDPQGATAAAGTCQRFVVRVRGGSRAVRGANVDVHATGPTDDLDFCDPGDGSARRAPDQGTGHNAEDIGEVTHAGQSPVAQHTEGETSDQGNFTIGIISPVPGDTTLTAWYDAGEEGFDNDTQDGGEATGSATTNWVESTGDAAISFLNPSPYGSAGTNIGRKQDTDAAYHLVARVSSVQPVPGVEFFYRSGSNPLVKIADARRVGDTDTYEAFWPVDVADGTYTLVARIKDTTITVEQSVTVRNQGSQTDPTVVPFETAEITSVSNGARAPFTRGRLTVRGIASAGAEGFVLYYTKAGPLSTPGSSAWTQCGTSTLPSGSSPKEFTLDCPLASGDQPGMVTGVAAIAYNCLQDCRASQTNHSGDAHRIFGAEADPSVALEPAETAANTGACQKFVLDVKDQTGQPIGGENVDIHLRGPGNSGNFCSPTDGTGTSRSAPDSGGHIADGDETDEAYHDEGGTRTQHTEGQTTGNGRFIFGIESETAGDAQLTAWLDANGDDLQSDGEKSDISVMHWETDAVCDVTGTDGPDTLEGSDASERICGFGGDDTITGGGGNDTITGGAGNDTLRGNAGDDSVRGGSGADGVFGGAGNDFVSGGSGNDVVNGHRGDDGVRGNAGNDRLNGGPGRDQCLGGRGRDRLRKCERGSHAVAPGGAGGAGSFAARTRPI